MKLNVMMPRLQMYALKCLALVAIMSMTYCSPRPKDQNIDKMTAKKALIKAIEYFPDKEYNSIENYEISVSGNGDEWQVLFTQYKPARVPGGHFTIVVPKGKGEIKLLRGE